MNDGRSGLQSYVFFPDPVTDCLGVLCLFTVIQQQECPLFTCVCFISRVLKPQSQFHKNKKLPLSWEKVNHGNNGGLSMETPWKLSYPLSTSLYYPNNSIISIFMGRGGSKQYLKRVAGSHEYTNSVQRLEMRMCAGTRVFYHEKHCQAGGRRSF